MPKPIKELSGSGLHVSMLLFKDGKNILSDGLENCEEFKYFISGIMNRINEITAILNPTRNSYKRLGEFNAPKYISYSEKNPNTLIKVTTFDKDKAKLTLRSVDPTTNPYLAFSLILNAGLKGIENKEILDENTNIKSIVGDTNPGNNNMLPSDFKDALNIFEKSIFSRECLGENLVYNFIEKRKKDLQIDEEIQELKYFLMH